jgi:hypothetical protein
VTSLCPSCARLGNIEQHCEVVTGASGQHKKMPERMEVRQAVENLEDYAHGIEQATQRNPEYAVPRESVL